MQALRGLYGVSWTKQGSNYTMHDSAHGALETELLRLGDFDRLNYHRQLQSIEASRQTDQVAEVLRYADTAALLSPAGVPLSALPLELQLKLRRPREEGVALALVGAHFRALDVSLESANLRIAVLLQRSTHTDNITHESVTTVTTPTVVALTGPGGASFEWLKLASIAKDLPYPATTEPAAVAAADQK